MVSNDKYISVLKQMDSCVSYGDYYSIKELSNLELEKIKKQKNEIKKDIKETQKKRSIFKNKNKEQSQIMEEYSQYILKQAERAKTLEELRERIISINEFINEVN